MNFDKLTAYLDTQANRGVPGCDLTVWVEHKPVYRHFAGERAPGVPMRGDELYWLYSGTKLFTMTAAMQLIERRLLNPDDPVSKYLPSYANLMVNDNGSVRPAKTAMTVEHLMSMQSGLDYNVSSPAIQACIREHGPDASTVQLADALANAPLHFEPGTRFMYGLSHDVVAAIIEVVSGMSFGEYVKQNISDPLGMENMTFHPTELQLDGLAARYSWDAEEKPVLQDNRFLGAFRLSTAYESGGAGLCGDVASYIRLSNALANGGVGCTGARILSRESIDDMRTNRAEGAALDDFRQMNKVGYGYGLGVRTMIDPVVSRSPIGEFGWSGAAGVWTMSDPANRISAFYAQHVLNCPRANGEFHPTMRNLIYEGLGL